MIKRIEDWILSMIQRRCTHPDNMVCADILEGDVNGIKVKHCRRCGAFNAHGESQTYTWSAMRLPSPNLWRG